MSAPVKTSPSAEKALRGLDVTGPQRGKKIPVKFKRIYAGFMPGKIAAFIPSTADALVAQGFATYALAEDASRVPPAPDADTPILQQSGDGGRPAGEQPAHPVVDIPDDWMNSHHMKKIALAREIDPESEVKTEHAAEQIIKAEIARRAASAQES